MTIVAVRILDSRTNTEAHKTLGQYLDVFTAPGLTIGRDPSCTIVLSSPKVPTVAISIVAQGHHLFRAFLSANATLPLDPAKVKYRRLGFGYEHASQPMSVGYRCSLGGRFWSLSIVVRDR
jgi:hypothetical protein